MNPKLFDVEVVQIRQLTPRVREYVLGTVTRAALPSWTAGAHIALHLTSPTRGQVVRHYSLIGGDGLQDDPPHVYRIAVQREEQGLGSNLIHETFEVGTTLRVGPPVNSFALDWNATQVLLLAGGIGITPLVPMARSLMRRKRAFEFVYSGRSVAKMAYARTLQDMCGAALRLNCSDTDGRLDMRALLAQQNAQTQVYVCGPTPFIQAATQAAQDLGWAQGRLRSEAFVSSVQAGDTPFTVSLQRSGREVQVLGDESLLDALSQARIPVFWDCRKGECGLCATRVLSSDGELLHRDRYLTEEEKRAGQSLCLCVSRTRGQSLVLDL
jgi:vanillate O-demethylase ferredoxin subunit